MHDSRRGGSHSGYRTGPQASRQAHLLRAWFVARSSGATVAGAIGTVLTADLRIRKLPNSENPYLQTKALALVLDGTPTQAITLRQSPSKSFGIKITISNTSHPETELIRELISQKNARSEQHGLPN